eukprot:NODE_2407_length_1126_cov_6.644383_g2000_i0.p5 GENE.NODE_2407_length_1126_cov_6.644383_g2000_i0~~NODE_2407_length_1126_cov_6.644383_g2000_i0.p5  ORF type:complete len:59 (+),score=2.46 NODE_2407_length_1126_cov_6.644383_g2000_i0:145-321(+)
MMREPACSDSSLHLPFIPAPGARHALSTGPGLRLGKDSEYLWELGQRKQRGQPGEKSG